MEQNFSIICEAIQKKFNKNRVLEHVNLSVRKGEIAHLRGKNGSGKTTLLQILNQTQNFDEGQLKIHGKTTYISSERRGLYPKLTGKENIELFKALINKKEMNENPYFKRIEPFQKALKCRMQNASMGMYQIIKTYCLSLRDPEIFLMDEPFSHLDTETKNIFGKFIESHSSKTFVLVTHDNEIAIHKPIKNYQLSEGRIVT